MKLQILFVVCREPWLPHIERKMMTFLSVRIECLAFYSTDLMPHKEKGDIDYY